MRAIYLTILLPMLLSLPCVAATPYFCDRQGSVLRYERRIVSSGKLKWLHEMTIERVSGRPDGSMDIEYSSDFRKPGGRRMHGGPIGLEASVSSRGDVVVDLAASMKSVMMNVFPDGAVSSGSCLSRLPSDMKAGDTLRDAAFSVSVAFAEYRVAVSERSVLRSERISTPAGDFDCMVVSEHKVEKGPGRNRTTTALTWYARGIGMVRHDTYDKNMCLETSEVLVALKNTDE